MAGIDSNQRNGTAQKILWTLFGLACTVIMVLLAAWANNVERRLDSMTTIVERRVDKLEERLNAVGLEQTKRSSRLDRLEEEMGYAKTQRQELYRMLGVKRP